MKRTANFLLVLSLMGSFSFIYSEEKSFLSSLKKPFIIAGAAAIGIGSSLYLIYKKWLPGVIVERENNMKMLRTLALQAHHLQERRDAIVLPPEDEQQYCDSEIIESTNSHYQAAGFVPADAYRSTVLLALLVLAKERHHNKQVIENEFYKKRLTDTDSELNISLLDIKDLCDDINSLISQSKKCLKKVDACYSLLGWKIVIGAINNTHRSEDDKRYQEERDAFIRVRLSRHYNEMAQIKAYRSTDYYGDLDLGSDASQETIKTKAKRLLSKLHPDKDGDKNEFCKVNNASMVLSDPIQRNIYDAVVKDQAALESVGAKTRRVNIRGLLEHSKASL